MPYHDIAEMCNEALEEAGDDELCDFISEDETETYDDVEPEVEFNNSFPNCIVLSNTPKVPAAKHDKLSGVLTKLLKKSGEVEFHMPINAETDMTLGFGIATFKTQEMARDAIAKLNGFALDKSHTFKVISIDKFDEIMNRADEFKAQSNVSCHSRADFRDWLKDSKCREQFLLRFHDQTEIYWHDSLAGKPQLVYGGEREKASGKVWCDYIVQWSPKGSYLATFHKPGIALWAGESFERKGRLIQDGDNKYLDFSPNEEFALTWNGAHHASGDTEAVRIHRVLSGECVFRRKTPEVSPLGTEFPHYLWSNDGQFFAECTATTIFVRDTKTFDIIRTPEGKKKALKYEATGLQTFRWSPRDNIIAVWTPENGNNPARLVLVEVPSFKEVRSCSRTQVEATMHWQNEGDYLGLLVTKKVGKTQKKGNTNVEIFRMRQKDIPVEIVELKDTVKGLYFEPKGSRFALITTDEAGLRPKLVIYNLGKEKIEQICANDLPGTNYNELYWAPDGRYFVLASVGQSGGEMLFCGVTPDNKFEVLQKEEHFMLTDVRWSPCSRYVISAVQQDMRDKSGGFRMSAESGLRIWSFQGRLLHSQQKEKLYSAHWRPHPPSLLENARQDKIRKDIRTFSRKYDAVDDQAKEQARTAFKREREEKMSTFNGIMDRLKGWKDDKYDEFGWNEAWEEWEENNEWSIEEVKLEEELGVSEELIST